MTDIAMCDNKICTLKQTCYRFNAIANEFRQSYGVFKQNKEGKCDYYWKDENLKDKKDEKISNR